MIFAIDSFSFYKHFGRHWFKPEKPVDIRWYCDKCLQLGAGGLHIDPYHIDMENEYDRVMDFAEENGMYVELGACGTASSDLQPYIEAAGRRGVRILRTFVGGSCLDSRETIKERVSKARQELMEVLPLAEKNGVIIAVENHGDIFIEDMEYIMGIESDSLGICFDSGNFAFTDEEPVKALELFSNRIVCTHLKDVCRQSFYPGSKPFETVAKPIHFCALGEGYFPMEDIIEKLVDIGMNKITLEICTPVINGICESEQLNNEIDAVKRSIDYLKSMT